MRVRALNLRKGPHKFKKIETGVFRHFLVFRENETGIFQGVSFVSKWKLICYLGCVEFKDKFKACCLGLLNIFG